jgi:hypothetical protein
MNCSDVQVVLPEITDRSENVELEAHLKSCVECSDLISELELIATEARSLAETDEPAERVWVRIAAELRSEGIIRDNVSSVRSVPSPIKTKRWNAWWLLPVAAALLAAGSYVIKPRPTTPVANLNPPSAATPVDQAKVQAKLPAQADNVTPSVRSATPGASTEIATVRDETANRAPMQTVGTSDQDLFNGVSPDMRSAFENQLRAVNGYIHDADAYLKQNPEDEDARQHLMDAYEQREMLYHMALDHVQ